MVAMGEWFHRGAGGALVLVMATLAACQSSAPALPFLPSPAARVNGHDVPWDVFQARLNVVEVRARASGLPEDASTADRKALEDQAINELIEEALIAQQAAAQHLAVPASEVSREWNQLATLLNGDRALQAFIARQGFTPASYRNFLRAHLLEAMLARHLARQRLVQVRERLVKGADFAQEVLRASDDRPTALRHGELGWVGASDLPAPLWAGVRGVTPPGLTDVVATEQGFVLAEVAERRPDAVRLRVVVATAPVASLYRPDTRPSWFADFLVLLRRQGRVEVNVGSTRR
jgi:parvulin-like peptidyl-prolyl isomerase